MPRIPDVLIESVVYLYPSVDEAKRGATSEDPGQGGTGFIVDFPVEDAPDPALRVRYIVTNSHVVGPGGQSPVVRINAVGGGFEVLPLTVDSWIHHSDGDDVAVAPIGLSGSLHKFRSLDWFTWAITEQEVSDWKVGPGDQVYFLGRFRYQEGRTRNMPTVRQGSIARMPLDEGVMSDRGIEQESFIVEAHSLIRYSGSPVFLFIPPFDWRGEMTRPPDHIWHHALIGIDWGHQNDLARVLGADRKSPSDEYELWVRQNSGLMFVVPAWRISSFLLADSELREQRQVALRKWLASTKS